MDDNSQSVDSESAVKGGEDDTRCSRKRALSSSDTTATPFRDVSQLYVHPSTLACAQSSGCLVCAYKIACFDVALDKEFTKVWPNQRPETCPRLKQQQQQQQQQRQPEAHRDKEQNHCLDMSRIVDWSCLQPNSRVLTVGDGDFSYSVALARHLGPRGARGLAATSYESRSTLERVYRKESINEYWDTLKAAGAHVYFDVDATCLPPKLQDTLWDLVVWNFPCTAVSSGQDGQNDAMEENKELVRRFCRRVEAHEIHLTHKTKPPYDQWGLVELVTSVQSQHQQHGAWKYMGRIVLDRALWCPYVPRKALDQRSFPCHDACTYVFQRGTANTWLDKALIPVTVERLQKLRDHWLKREKSNKKAKQKKNHRR